MKFRLVAILLVVLFIEAASFVTLRILAEPEKVEPQEMFEFHPKLGKVLKKNFKGESFRTGEVVTYETDFEGRRQPKNFSKGECKLSIIGDSFAQGFGLNIKDTWFGKLKRSQPHLAISNESVSGYGIDQVFLKFLDSEKVADEVLFYFGTIGGDRHFQRYMFGRPKPLIAFKNEKFRVIDDHVKRTPDGILMDHLPAFIRIFSTFKVLIKFVSGLHFRLVQLPMVTPDEKHSLDKAIQIIEEINRLALRRGANFKIISGVRGVCKHFDHCLEFFSSDFLKDQNGENLWHLSKDASFELFKKIDKNFSFCEKSK